MLLIVHGLFVYAHERQPAAESTFWSFGGPAELELAEHSGSLLGTVTQPTTSPLLMDRDLSEVPSILLEQGMAVGVSHSFSNVIPTRDGLKKYKVREGDTLSTIAAQFGISLDTIKWANPSAGNTISPGQELTILPISGIMYEVVEGDTVEGLAARYHINAELIRRYNENYQAALTTPGERIVLPYASPINRWAYMNRYEDSLPNYDSYYTMPAEGWNWGELHYYNAVDIAAACGEPIVAAAEGIIREEVSDNRWNQGYGNYIVIEHTNGTETLYSHTLKNLVAQDEYVLQGEQIALIGNTGNTHGPTGCHLHFEVHGAQNPFVVK